MTPGGFTALTRRLVVFRCISHDTSALHCPGLTLDLPYCIRTVKAAIVSFLSLLDNFHIIIINARSTHLRVTYIIMS